MNNKAIGVLAFVAGAAVGSVVTWKVTKTKYETILQEEIDSVKAEFSKGVTKIVEKTTVDTAKIFEKQENPEKTEYDKLINNLDYTSHSNDDKPLSVKNNQVYVIPPESAGEEDYDIVSLTYYADEVLAYDDGKIVENVEDTVGSESLTSFGEYEDDSVYVRNNIMKTDFEILRDTRKYSVVMSMTSSTSNDDQQCET